MRNSLTIPMMLLALLTLAPKASAADGVFEINQLCAATGCFTGDDPGFPVQITVEGSYILTSNLEIGSTDTSAILVTAAGVGKLDLNGFAIEGPVICFGFPVSSCSPTSTAAGIDAGASNIAIQGGSVRGFGAGIVTGSGVLSDLSIARNSGPGIFAGGLTLRDSQVSANLGSGIQADSFIGPSVSVSDVSLVGNGGDGIRLIFGTVLNSTISNNRGVGIFADISGANVGYGFNLLYDNGDSTAGPVAVLGCNLVDGSSVCPP